eukprot:5918401-Ditylum_brightwellii.AAC.1
MVFPTKTSCSGNLCERQRINDWNGFRGCGCYGMPQNSSSLMYKHAMDIGTGTGSMSISDFSSLKFSQLYLSGDIPGSCKLCMLQYMEAAMNMQIALDDCIKLINDNDGFTVARWYKREIINDQSLFAARKIVNNNSNNNSSNNNGNNHSEDLQVGADQTTTLG